MVSGPVADFSLAMVGSVAKCHTAVGTLTPVRSSGVGTLAYVDVQAHCGTGV
jgi:hypothetical protein